MSLSRLSQNYSSINVGAGDDLLVPANAKPDRDITTVTIASHERFQIARLLYFVMLGELLARNCARRQVALSSDSNDCRFL